MEQAQATWHYLRGLEWSERAPRPCIFCGEDPDSKLENIIPIDDLPNSEAYKQVAFAAKPLREAGEFHCMIMPIEHIRDCESLKKEDLDLCELT